MPSISIPTGAAILGAGAIGGVASIASGAMNASAASSAANAQTQSSQQALQLQAQEFAQVQKNLSPYMTGGANALTSYQNLIGGNGNAAQQSAISGLQTNPLYTSLVGAGDQAVLANASATGGLRSGNTSYNLANFNANALAQTYQSQIGNLGSLTSLGENAAAGAGNAAQSYANSASNILGNIGSAQAGGILGSSGALTGGINSGLSSILGGIGGNYGYGSGLLGALGGGSSYGNQTGTVRDVAGLY